MNNQSIRTVIAFIVLGAFLLVSSGCPVTPTENSNAIPDEITSAPAESSSEVCDQATIIASLKEDKNNRNQIDAKTLIPIYDPANKTLTVEGVIKGKGALRKFQKSIEKFEKKLKSDEEGCIAKIIFKGASAEGASAPEGSDESKTASSSYFMWEPCLFECQGICQDKKCERGEANSNSGD